MCRLHYATFLNKLSHNTWKAFRERTQCLLGRMRKAELGIIPSKRMFCSASKSLLDASTRYVLSGSVMVGVSIEQAWELQNARMYGACMPCRVFLLQSMSFCCAC